MSQRIRGITDEEATGAVVSWIVNMGLFASLLSPLASPFSQHRMA